MAEEERSKACFCYSKSKNQTRSKKKNQHIFWIGVRWRGLSQTGMGRQHSTARHQLLPAYRTYFGCKNSFILFGAAKRQQNWNS